ncbi:tetratricopeptide repeat protein [Pseudomonas sp.]|uniref:tetratricopeptide repeat protein n=1 Tax=Pseudomonas sp. TaxID=306 RepID=UPI00272BB6AF|nr:tetratricopeptide repeat protein [Pseudomonas sp.]
MNAPMKPAPRTTLLTAALSLWLAGCAATGQPPAPVPTAPETEETALLHTPEPEPPAPITYGQFSKETLFALLTAEIAGQRNRFDIALSNYVEQAYATRDAGIIERAMQVSEFLGAQQTALDLSLLWIDVAPDNPDALRAGALQLARAGSHERAMELMQRVLAMQAETNFDFLALAAAQSDPEARQGILRTLENLLERNPGNAQLVFATALLLQQENREEEALRLLEALPDAESSEASVMLQARLLAGQGDLDRSIEALQEGLRQHPDDPRLRVLLARMLVTNGDLEAATPHFRILLEQNPNDVELITTLGLLNLESGNPRGAIGYLRQAAQLSGDNSLAVYHLGLALAEDGQAEAAVQAWKGIGEGNEFLTSRLQIARVLVEQKRFDELAETLAEDRRNYPAVALPLYLIEIETLLDADPQRAMERTNEALQEFEQDSSLLYTRAMLAERLGDPAGLERDLRAIIDREPDNAMALNALGYTLADRNERLDEALELIERAHALEPDDPAIIDSLGWVHFRLGNLDLAEELLRQAYAAFPDQEVAAHLGEVLWELGRRDEARAIWNEAQESGAEAPTVRATRERLEARQ